MAESAEDPDEEPGECGLRVPALELRRQGNRCRLSPGHGDCAGLFSLRLLVHKLRILNGRAESGCRRVTALRDCAGGLPLQRCSAAAGRRCRFAGGGLHRLHGNRFGQGAGQSGRGLGVTPHSWFRLHRWRQRGQAPLSGGGIVAENQCNPCGN